MTREARGVHLSASLSLNRSSLGVSGSWRDGIPVKGWFAAGSGAGNAHFALGDE
jgi:hypothetical protein